MGFFGDVERFLVELYPYRWWIVTDLVIFIVVVTAVGYRAGWHKVIWRHRLAAAVRRHKLASTWW